MVSADDVVRELGIPRSTLYRLVRDGTIPSHPRPKQPWHKRQTQGFRLSEVCAALGLEPPKQTRG